MGDEVYVAKVDGGCFGVGLGRQDASAERSSAQAQTVAARPTPLKPRLTEKEKAAHAEFLAALPENALWNDFS